MRGRVRQGTKNSGVIIVKLDDLLFHGNRMYFMVRVIDWLSWLIQIKVCWGVMGQELHRATESNRILKLFRRLIRTGRHVVWNHGWTHVAREFKCLSLNDAVKHIQQTQSIVRERLGVTMTTFGAPWNAYNQNTERALLKCPEITSWFFGETSYAGMCFPYPAKFEVPYFHPNFKCLRSLVRALGPSRSVVLQMHPAYWNLRDLFVFVVCMVYLKYVWGGGGGRFLFPDDVSEQMLKTFPTSLKGITPGDRVMYTYRES